MSHAVIYARKSTESEDKQVLSIESQIHDLKILALRRGLEIREVLSESHSAKAPGRPVFGQLMRRIHKGEIRVVLCWKMDRLARNHYDTGQVLQALADGGLEQVVTPERTYTRDGNDRFLGNFELGIATKYIDDLRANVRRGNRQRFRNGWPNFRPPIGYLEDHVTKTVIKDPERFDLVRRMWTMLLSGAMSPRQILKIATSEWGLRTRKTPRQGGVPLSRSVLYHMFQNPFYAGQLRLRSGEVYAGRHVPMVTPEEFARVQDILGRPGRPRPIRHTFTYAGLFLCAACNGTVIPEEHVKASGRRYVYYRCHKCRKARAPERAIDEKIAADLKRLELPEEAIDWLVEQLRPRIESDLGHHQQARQHLETELQQAQSEGEVLLTLRLRSQIDEASFDRRRLEILERQALLKQRLERPDRGPDELVAQLQAVLKFGAEAHALFCSSDAVQRRAIAVAVGSNFQVNGKEPLYLAKEPYSFALQTNMLSNMVNPERRSSKQVDTWMARLHLWLVEKPDWRPPNLELMKNGSIHLDRPVRDAA